jgi:hypothetical protein
MDTVTSIIEYASQCGYFSILVFYALQFKVHRIRCEEQLFHLKKLLYDKEKLYA